MTGIVADGGVLQTDEAHKLRLLVKSILHGGTFDVANYGDLLFPSLLKKRLGSHSVTHFSPTAAAPVWSDCVSVASAVSLADTPVDGLVIGGGNIVHAMPAKLHDYEAAGVSHTAYADLWVCSALAVDDSVPVIWNAPGVPGHFETELIDVARSALRRADYLSVRDEESRECLLEVDPHLRIAVVPDCAWDVPRLWTSEALDTSHARLMEDLGGTGGERTLSIHVNSRYISEMSLEAVAEILDDMALRLEARPLLIAIGPCHGDDKTALHVSRCMSTRPLVLHRPESLMQVAAALSRSCCYVGSSMHGYITAAAFGVPAIAVARGKHKFAGVTRQVSAPETLAPSWMEAQEVLQELDREALLRKVHAGVRDAHDRLDKHWSRIAELLEARAFTAKGTFQATDFHRARANVLAAIARYFEIRNAELREISQRVKAGRGDTGKQGRPGQIATANTSQRDAGLAAKLAAAGEARTRLAEELAAAKDACAKAQAAVANDAAARARLAEELAAEKDARAKAQAAAKREAATRSRVAEELAVLRRKSHRPGWLLKRLWRVLRGSTQYP